MSSERTPEERIAEWVERDAVLGRTAQVDELRSRLAAVQSENAQLRVRMTQLANAVVQAEVERDHYRRVAGSGVPLEVQLRRTAKTAVQLGGKVARKVRGR